MAPLRYVPPHKRGARRAAAAGGGMEPEEEIAEEKHPQLDIKLIFKYTINNIQKYGRPNTKCLLVNVIV